MIAKTVTYAGRVQGVGFRYTACRVAQGYEVTGYVRNLPDGRVELLAEGEEQTVAAFLDALAAAMAGHIRDTQIVDTPATGRYTRFDVRY